MTVNLDSVPCQVEEAGWMRGMMTKWWGACLLPCQRPIRVQGGG